ncbi:MAG: Dam family site-specific DNA-(adenine-N6)-methyltransferase [Rhodospirillaceae bacterium]
MADLKPLFPFAGGKTQYIKHFSRYFQPCETYVEPFIGGGAVFCYIVNHERAKKFIINDENSELMRLYADIKSNPRFIAEEATDVAKRYRDNPDGELEYAYLAELAAYKKIQTSGRLLFLLNTAFGGMWKKDKNGLFDSPSGHLNSIRRPGRAIIPIEQIYLWHEALKRTEIFSGDYSSIAIPDNSIVYCDPPYRQISFSYDSRLDDDGQRKLFLWCSDISKRTDICVIQTNLYSPFFVDMVNNISSCAFSSYPASYSNGFGAITTKEIVMVWNSRFKEQSPTELSDPGYLRRYFRLKR